MKKFKGLLFCTDLDGTLYNSEHKVSRRNLEAIEYFKENGGFFTFVTGRSPLTAISICETIHPNAPYGCINGGGIFDHKANKYLWNAVLPKEAMELVREVDIKLPEIGFQLNTENDIIFCKENADMRRFRDITGVANHRAHYNEVREPILKVVFAHDDMEQMRQIEEILTAHPVASLVDFIRSEKTFFEILPKGVSKGNVLTKMAEFLGVNKQKTIAVGDYYNDVSMIKAAGLGFAVGNALEDVKKIADYVTVSNDDDAIAAIIEGLDNGTYKI